MPSGFVVEIYDRKDPVDPTISQTGLQSRVLTNAQGVAAYSYVFPTHYSGGNGYTVVVRDPKNSQVLGRSVNVQVAPEGSTVTVASSRPSPAAYTRVIAVDLKTRLADKAELSAIVAGVSAHAAVADWVKVKEFGEDFSVWLGSLKRIRHGDSIAVQLAVELRTAASVNVGKQLDARYIKFSYSIHGSWNGEPSVRSMLERRWAALSLPGLRGKRDEVVSEGLFVGERVLEALREMLPVH